MEAHFYQFEPLVGRAYSCHMNTIVKRSLPVMQTLARIFGALAMLAIALFCVFGFLAPFEPGNGFLWKVVYGAVGCAFMTGAVALSRRTITTTKTAFACPAVTANHGTR
jgi:hypothetical protein